MKGRRALNRRSSGLVQRQRSKEPPLDYDTLTKKHDTGHSLRNTMKCEAKPHAHASIRAY